MSRIVYQATVYNPNRKQQDFDKEEDAVDHIERSGGGGLIKFNVEPNRPGCLPAEVYRSYALSNFENGVWKQIDISRG